MPRKFITVTLDLRVTYAIILTNLFILAPLPVEESDVESAAEDVPSTNTEPAKINDEPTDATMKEEDVTMKEEDEEDDEDDEEDPETSVWALID